MLPRLCQILQLLVDCHRGHGTAQTKEKFRKKAFGTESISTLFSSQLKKQYSLRPLQRGVSLSWWLCGRPLHKHINQRPPWVVKCHWYSWFVWRTSSLGHFGWIPGHNVFQHLLNYKRGTDHTRRRSFQPKNTCREDKKGVQIKNKQVHGTQQDWHRGCPRKLHRQTRTWRWFGTDCSCSRRGKSEKSKVLILM